jgi:hypothetical protein
MTNQFSRKLKSPLVWLAAITISGVIVSLLAVLGAVTRMRRRENMQLPPLKSSRARTRIEPVR